MIAGFDYLGAVKFQSAMLAAHKNGWSAGIFLRTFGDARKTLEAMCKNGKFSEIVIHLAPFDRTHKYVSTGTIYEDAKYCESIAKKYPNTKLLLSPFCEHTSPISRMLPIFNKLQTIAPHCLMVNSIYGAGQVVPGIITEIHLENSKPRKKPTGEYIVTFDGFGGKGEGDFADCNFQEIAARYKDARQIRGWAFRCNGKFGHNDKTPLEQRKHWPSKEYLEGHLCTMYAREGKLTYPKDALYKAFADDHGKGGKDNKAMVIHKKKTSKLMVMDSRNNHIDTMNRVLPDYSGSGAMKGYARYYSSKYAYQIAETAKKKTGSSLIKIDSLLLTDGFMRSGQF